MRYFVEKKSKKIEEITRDSNQSGDYFYTESLAQDFIDQRDGIVRYFVPGNKNEIMPLPKSVNVRGMGEYFNSRAEAKKYILARNKFFRPWDDKSKWEED